MNMIPTPTISEIMREEFMKPLDIDIFTLAENTGLPVHELREILSDQRDIDLTVSQKLGAFFGISDTFFLNVQREIQARKALYEHRKEKELPFTESLSGKSLRLATR